MARIRVVLITAAALATVVAGAGAATPALAQITNPPPLSPEIFEANDVSILNGECALPQPSTFSFSSSGEATGTYPGTYTETGSFTVYEPADPSQSSVMDFSASFTILSGDTVITGTKTLAGPYSANAGTCGPDPAQVDLTTANCEYSATIQTSTGAFVDRGHCATTVDGAPFYPGYFYEGLGSDLTETTPLDTPGASTGGGQVAPQVTFGFNARNDAMGFSGTCNVVDPASDVHIRCLDVRSYAQTPTHATFSGDAQVDGVLTSYRIDVQDNGEPGTQDTFAIVTGSGYTAGGVLTHGNVQIHS